MIDATDHSSGGMLLMMVGLLIVGIMSIAIAVWIYRKEKNDDDPAQK